MTVHFKDVQLMNKARIAYLQEMKQDTKSNEMIDKIFEDEVCFFKMDKDDAYMILDRIGIPENKQEEVYNELISRREYYDLKNKGKIDINDEELKIKYEDINSDNMFK